MSKFKKLKRKIEEALEKPVESLHIAVVEDGRVILEETAYETELRLDPRRRAALVRWLKGGAVDVKNGKEEKEFWYFVDGDRFLRADKIKRYFDAYGIRTDRDLSEVLDGSKEYRFVWNQVVEIKHDRLAVKNVFTIDREELVEIPEVRNTADWEW